MSLPQSPMQLLPVYHGQLGTKFLAWYRPLFSNTRRAYGHWSAGGCQQDDAVYHQMVVLDHPKGHAELDRNTPITVDTFAHTYKRNTDSFAMCFAGFFDSAVDKMGTAEATPEMIQLFIRTLATNCIDLHMPVGNFMSHGEAADNRDFPTMDDPGAPHDPYGPGSADFERWDLLRLIDPADLSLHPGLSARDNLIMLPDYIRGQAILLIQSDTKSKWS